MRDGWTDGWGRFLLQDRLAAFCCSGMDGLSCFFWAWAGWEVLWLQSEATCHVFFIYFFFTVSCHLIMVVLWSKSDTDLGVQAKVPYSYRSGGM
ncbi:hypothetical protein QBC35DRAFT_87546 [Podospora australis]|uniref:Uncharacterized protein n=1 Tax=Podospora australis TaxID=1536484 RepID=A0AAN7ALX9_9PEZI|nr:hypothetical protein QBC35DRAFT_87546 [Podospora australis]